MLAHRPAADDDPAPTRAPGVRGTGPHERVGSFHQVRVGGKRGPSLRSASGTPGPKPLQFLGKKRAIPGRSSRSPSIEWW